MKNIMEIAKCIQEKNENIQKLQAEIVEIIEIFSLSTRRKSGAEFNKHCNAIQARQLKMAILEGEIFSLKWVVGE